MKKRVLVTGATGFIGRHSLQPLLNRGFEVHAAYKDRPLMEETNVLWHQADLLNESSIKNLCAEVKASHLLHFAWYAVPSKYWTSSENTHWQKSTLELIRAFRENGGRRATCAGTCAEYDWSIPQESLSEKTSPIKPLTIYGRAKNDTRIAAEEFAKQNGLSLSWGRIFFLYGPHEAKERLVPYVITSLLSGQPALCTPGEQIRDFLHVGDVADAFATLLDSNAEGTVNIASGIPVALKDIVSSLGEMMRCPELIRLGAKPAPDNDPPRLVADVRRLTKEIEWKPNITLEDGLRMTIEWWRENRE